MSTKIISSADGSKATIEVSGVAGPDFLSNGMARPAFTNGQSITGTATFNYTPQLHGQVCALTVNGAGVITFGAPVGITEGVGYKLMIKAGDSSSRLFAWNVAYKFPSGITPVSTGSINTNAYDIITFIGGPSNTLIFDGAQLDVR